MAPFKELEVDTAVLKGRWSVCSGLLLQGNNVGLSGGYTGGKITPYRDTWNMSHLLTFFFIHNLYV